MCAGFMGAPRVQGPPLLVERFDARALLDELPADDGADIVAGAGGSDGAGAMDADVTPQVARCACGAGAVTWRSGLTPTSPPTVDLCFERFRLLLEAARAGVSEEEHIALAAAQAAAILQVRGGVGGRLSLLANGGALLSPPVCLRRRLRVRRSTGVAAAAGTVSPLRVAPRPSETSQLFGPAPLLPLLPAAGAPTRATLTRTTTTTTRTAGRAMPARRGGVAGARAKGGPTSPPRSSGLRGPRRPRSVARAVRTRRRSAGARRAAAAAGTGRRR